jgi:hypothetical protein
MHLADEPDLHRFNLTEVGAALAAKGYFIPQRGLHRCRADLISALAEIRLPLFAKDPSARCAVFTAAALT